MARRRNLLALVAGTAAVLALAACGGSAYPPQAADGTITLNLWTWAGAPGKDALQPALDAYQKSHPKIRVVDTELAQTDFKSKVPLSLNSGRPIDVLAVQPNQFAQDIHANLLPLSAWQQHLPPGATDRIAPLYREQNQRLYADGQVYGMPMAASGSAVVFYNADLLAKAGVKPPTTWDDVATLAAALKQRAPGVSAVVMPSSATDSWFQDEFVLTLVGQRDPGFYDQARYRGGPWDTPSYVQGLRDYQRLFTTGALSPDLNDIGYDRAMELFDSGKAALLVTGTWESKLLSAAFRKANKIDISSVGAIPLPALQDPSTRSLRSFLDVTLGIPEKSPHVKEAADLIAYLTVGDGVALWAHDLGEVPTLRSWKPADGVLADDAARQGWATITELIAHPHSDRNNLSSFSGQIGSRLLTVAKGADPQAAARQMQDDYSSGRYF